MTADLARPLQLLLLSLMATLLSIPAFAETLIIVPADENGSTTMSRDIAKGVVIPIMKSGKHKVIPYKNYRQAALADGVKETALSEAASMAEHAAKLGATKGVEVKVLRQGSGASVKVVDLKAKEVVFEKSMKLKGSSLTGAEGKSLIAEIYTVLAAKAAPKPEPAVAAATPAADAALHSSPAPQAAAAPKQHLHLKRRST